MDGGGRRLRRRTVPPGGMSGLFHPSAGWGQAAKYVAAFLVPLGLSLVLTPLVRWLCAKACMVDRPGERRIHERPVPRGGGIAIFLSFHAVCALWFVGMPGVSLAGLTADWWAAFVPPSALLLLVGVADDRFGLRPSIKLLGQVASAALAVLLGLQMGTILWWTLPPWVDALLTVLVCVAVINAFNLIDGMDGLASGLAAVASLGMAGAFILQRNPASAMLVLALAGASAGFLVYNFHPASVFLGDSGSMFLGFTLASIALTTSSKSTAMAALGIPLLAFGVPVLDTLLAIWRRSIRKQYLRDRGGAAVSRGDLDHLHHRLARKGLTQRRVAGLLYLTNGAGILAGLAMLTWKQGAVSIFLIAFVVGTYVIFRHYASVEMAESGRLLAAGLRRPARRSVPALLYPAVDFGLLALALTVGIEHDLATNAASFKERWLAAFPCLVCVPFLALAATGNYRRVWSRARVSEFAVAGIAVGGGVVIGAALLNLVDPMGPGTLVGTIAVVAGLGGPAVLGIRALPRLIQDAMAWSRRQRMANAPDAHRILIYGAGYGYTLMMRHDSFEHPDRESPRIVVGLIDDDPNLRNRVVFGHRILGGIGDLERVTRDLKVDEVVLSTPLGDDRRARILEIAVQAGFAVSQWAVSMQQIAACRQGPVAVAEESTPMLPGFITPQPARISVELDGDEAYRHGVARSA